MNLTSVCANVDGKPSRKRVGRGIGSGIGKTCGRGHKGNGSRSGRKFRLMFEGGQTPLPRRVAKRGFNGKEFEQKYTVVTLSTLARLCPSGGLISASFFEVNGIRSGDVKVIGGMVEGGLPKFNLEVSRISSGAETAVLAAGGSVTLI